MQTQPTPNHDGNESLDMLRKLRTFLIERDYYGSSGQIAQDCRADSQEVWTEWLTLMADVNSLLEGKTSSVPAPAAEEGAMTEEAALIDILREAANTADPKTGVFQIRVDNHRFRSVVIALRDTHKLVMRAEDRQAWKYHHPYLLTTAGKEALDTGRIPEPFVC